MHSFLSTHLAVIDKKKDKRRNQKDRTEMSKQTAGVFKQSNSTAQQWEGVTYYHNHMAKSQKQHTVQKKPHIKEYMLYDSTIGNSRASKTNLW